MAANFRGTQHGSVTLATNNAPPAITSFTPATGPAGSQVMLTGRNFLQVAAVAFNGKATSNCVVNSSTQITVTVPTGATTGLIAVAAHGGSA